MGMKGNLAIGPSLLPPSLLSPAQQALSRQQRIAAGQAQPAPGAGPRRTAVRLGSIQVNGLTTRLDEPLLRAEVARAVEQRLRPGAAGSLPSLSPDATVTELAWHIAGAIAAQIPAHDQEVR